MATKPPLPNLETKALPPLPRPADSPVSPHEKRLSSQTIPTIIQPSPTLGTPLRPEPEQNYARLQELYELEKERTKVLEVVRGENAVLRGRNRELERRVEELVLENEMFRGQIFELRSGQGCDPRRGEEYYIHLLEELKSFTEKEVVKLSKGNGDVSLTRGQQEHVLKDLDRAGEHGRRSAEYFRREFGLERVYSQGKWRHQVVRHVVGVFLVELVFKPFAFGLSREISEGLQFVERDTLLHGLNPSRHI